MLVYEFAEIRNEVKKVINDEPWCEFRYSVMSDLNWLRYIAAIQFLKGFIPEKSKVLELGCGLGHTTAMLAVVSKNIEIIGTDIVEAPTWNYFSKYGCTFKVCDATNIFSEDAQFDFIISFGVIEHVSSDTKFLKEVYRCLKNRGYNIIFNLPNKYSIWEFFAKLLGWKYHRKRYLNREIIELFKNNKFEIISIKRKHLLPGPGAERISNITSKIFNKFYKLLFKLDELLSKTLLSIFCQDFEIISRRL